MAILSSPNIIRSLAVFHVTLAHYLFTAPITLAEQNMVIILGAAMDLPLPSESMHTPSSATGFAGLLLLVLALYDFTAPTATDELGSLYWSAQAPLRAAFYFLSTGGIYLWKFGLEESKKKQRIAGSAGATLSIREGVCNSFVFSFVFIEMLVWFWIFTVVREERRDLLAKKEMKQRAEEDRL